MLGLQVRDVICDVTTPDLRSQYDPFALIIIAKNCGFFFSEKRASR